MSNLVTNLYSLQRHHERILRSKQQQIKQFFYGKRISQQQAQYLKQLNKELELLNKFIHKMSYKTKRRNNYNGNNNAYYNY